MHDQVHLPLQNSFHRPLVGALYVHLPLVAVGLRVEPRVAAVPEVRIRDVGYAYDAFTLFKSVPGAYSQPKGSKDFSRDLRKAAERAFMHSTESCPIPCHLLRSLVNALF
jgi:hypothetical protein